MFKPSIPSLIPSAAGDTFSIRGWKVFDRGMWKGHYFSPARIAGILANFRYLKSILPGYSPKFRLGHDRKQRISASLGLPNIGRVVDMRPNGTGFEVDIDGIPKIIPMLDKDGKVHAFDLEAAMRNGNFDGGSVDMTSKMQDPADPRHWLEDIFDGVALLGEEHPAVRTTGKPGDHIVPSAELQSLAFSEYSEDSPMPSDLTMADLMPAASAPAPPFVDTTTPAQPNATAGTDDGDGDKDAGGDDVMKLAEAMHLDPSDPVIEKLRANPDIVDAFLDSLGSDKFAAGMKQKFAAPAPEMPPNPPTDPTATPAPGLEAMATQPANPNMPVAGAGAPITQEQFAAVMKDMDDVKKRCFAAEAALDDYRKTANGTATNGAMTMSEAHNRIEACVKDGKLPKVLADKYKQDAKTLVGLAPAQMCFSAADAPAPELAGKARIAVFIEQLESRPVDLMFAEKVMDMEDAAADVGAGFSFTADEIAALNQDRAGRQTLEWMQSKKAAA